MGNILIDMMGLLSRKRVVKTYEDTDMLVLGRRPNADDSIFNTPKMHNELISIKDLRAQFDTGEVTGSGTTGFLPVYKDGANSVIGDSQLREGQLGNGLYQMRFENADRFIINKPSSVLGGDPEYLVQQDGQYKSSFGWDDDGGGFAFLYNYTGQGIKLGAAGNNPMLEIKTTEGAKEIDLHESIKFVDYGSGSKTGTATYNLSVDSSGKVIETAISGGGTLNTEGFMATTGSVDLATQALKFIGKDGIDVYVGQNNANEVEIEAAALVPLDGSRSMNGGYTPSNAQDVATKAYVDSQSGGISQTTGTITPSVSAGISGINYNHQFGYWTRTGNMVDVYLSVSIGSFTKTDVTQKLVIKDAFPYDIHIQRQFFNGDLLSYVNISDSGTAIPALYIANPDISGSDAYDIQFIRSANYTLTTTNKITTNEMSTGSFAVELSFRYRCTDSTLLRTGASIDS
jgi:hypothetical protein|tara:strand:- start:4181 stop:5554 length:1374 start_codon:yes stop_codon:yes gene_type:complete